MALPACIPTIDLVAAADPDHPNHAVAVESLGRGLQKYGFVILDNHGIDPELIDRSYAAFERFFALDEGAKRRYSGIEGGARGFTPFGVEHAKDSPHPDLKEFWHVGPDASVSGAHPHIPGNVWPEEVPELREAAKGLYSGLEDCGATLLRCIAEYFGLGRDTFARMIVGGNTILRSIHYPPIGEDAPEGSVRAAAHEDINLITLLVEATASGLELFSEGRWMAVNAQPGQIVADVGDMLARVTNDVLPATTHRVVNTAAGRTTPRYSMPLFVHPHSDRDLSVMPEFTSPEQPAKYPPITAGAFLEQRLREIGLL
jgi:isopenicillin N synthase-like dioxygenase